MLREELQLLQEPGSYVGEVVKVMGKSKVLVKVNYFFFYTLPNTIVLYLYDKGTSCKTSSVFFISWAYDLFKIFK